MGRRLIFVVATQTVSFVVGVKTVQDLNDRNLTGKTFYVINSLIASIYQKRYC